MTKSVTPTILIGKTARIGTRGQLSAIDKQPIPGPWHLSAVGLTGDEQANTKHHGGPEKALHHYPLDHYAAWRHDLGDHSLLKQPGAFGENISTNDMTETSVHIGDIFRFGDAILQVSQGRQPCATLNIRFGIGDMARRVQNTGRTGWYYRVLEGGEVAPDATLVLCERCQPRWPLSRAVRLLYHDVDSYDELQEMAEIGELAEGWRKLAAARVRNREVEDWRLRLEGA